MSTGGALLGEILLRRNLVSPEQLEAALERQRHSGGRLGDVLIALRAVAPKALMAAVADHCGLECVNLLESPPDETLLNESDAEEYLRLRALPWKRENGVIWLATSEPNLELHAWACERYNAAYRLVVTSPFDIRAVVERRFGAQLGEESRNRLWRDMPERSARETFHPQQRATLLLLLAAALACLFFAPAATLMAFIMLLHFIYGSTMLFKWLVFQTGLRHPPRADPRLRNATLADADLPVHTVLVPMYREKESLPHLLAALRRMDYPPQKLDIKLVLEADDADTIAAAMAIQPPWNVEIIRVPPSQPRTKPKALNYALRYARGAYATVYDAEDDPDPQQLKKAALAFHALPPNVACLQSRLNYYNANDNLLTRCFAMEYAILFEALLPGLQTLSIPMPLGGTSNHLAMDKLKRAGEWDPYNVTEDADLGVRLSALGFRTAMIDSVTMEEAPLKFSVWLNQRSRWIKGYMQTWLVHMRDPFALWRQLGTRSFLGFQFFVGLACATFLSAPLIWLLSILAWYGADSSLLPAFPRWLSALAMFNLVLHFIAHWAQAKTVMPHLAGYEGNAWKFRFAALCFPLYWALHSLASYKALWQLIFNPHFWEKTTHGVAKRVIPG